MRNREVPRAEWKAFFDAFSRNHVGWQVTVDVLGSDLGAQHEIVDLPLIGITCESAGSRVVQIHAGTPPSHLTHTIEKVTHVRLEQTDDEADAALQVQDEEGTTVILQFRRTDDDAVGSGTSGRSQSTS
jgi:hypothetical protein